MSLVFKRAFCPSVGAKRSIVTFADGLESPYISLEAMSSLQPEYSRHILKVDNKIVTIGEFDDGKKMCAMEAQNDNRTGYEVDIQTRSHHNGKQMLTLCFIDKSNKRQYRPMVVEDLQVEDCDGDINHNQDKYWFFKESLTADNTYSLSAVLKPNYYLTVLAHRPYTFSLVDNINHSAQVTQEER